MDGNFSAILEIQLSTVTSISSRSRKWQNNVLSIKSLEDAFPGS